MAQVVALVMVAQVAGAAAGGPAITSVKVGQFLSMPACRDAAEHAVPVGVEATTHVSFVCVPLSPAPERLGPR